MGWIAKVDEDGKHGRQGSVEDWAHYSALKHRLIANIDTLIAQLGSTMSQATDKLDFSYQSLDVVSAYVEGTGVARAQQEIYITLWPMSVKCSDCVFEGIGKSTTTALGSPTRIWWERCMIP